MNAPVCKTMKETTSQSRRKFPFEPEKSHELIQKVPGLTFFSKDGLYYVKESFPGEPPRKTQFFSFTDASLYFARLREVVA